jgi:hypothetical protein
MGNSVDDMVHSVGEGATKGDAIDTAALHALVKFGLVQEQMLGWKFYLLNIALCGSLRSHNTFIERVREDNTAVAIRWGYFIDRLTVEWSRTFGLVSHTSLSSRICSYPSTVNDVVYRRY